MCAESGRAILVLLAIFGPIPGDLSRMIITKILLRHNGTCVLLGTMVHGVLIAPTVYGVLLSPKVHSVLLCPKVHGIVWHNGPCTLGNKCVHKIMEINIVIKNKRDFF